MSVRMNRCLFALQRAGRVYFCSCPAMFSLASYMLRFADSPLRVSFIGLGLCARWLNKGNTGVRMRWLSAGICRRGHQYTINQSSITGVKQIMAIRNIIYTTPEEAESEPKVRMSDPSGRYTLCNIAGIHLLLSTLLQLSL